MILILFSGAWGNTIQENTWSKKSRVTVPLVIHSWRNPNLVSEGTSQRLYKWALPFFIHSMVGGDECLIFRGLREHYLGKNLKQKILCHLPFTNMLLKTVQVSDPFIIYSMVGWWWWMPWRPPAWRARWRGPRQRWWTPLLSSPSGTSTQPTSQTKEDQYIQSVSL